MDVVNLLAPIFLIIALGAGLQRGGLLPTEVVAGINRLLYWVGLPSAVFHSLVVARGGAEGFGVLLGVMAAATLLNAALAWLEAPALGVAATARGTYTQAAFRGNLSFIALPLLLSVPGVPVGRTMLAFAPMLILHNALTVVVLLVSQHKSGGRMWRTVIFEIGRNPIIVASLAGVTAHVVGWVPPQAALTTLQALAQMALPLALLCVGAALVGGPVRSSRRVLPVLTSLHKVVVAPVLGYVLARWIGLDRPSLLALMICLACPTAAVSYTMVKQIGGDENLAANAVVFSSVASAVSLGLVIALFAV